MELQAREECETNPLLIPDLLITHLPLALPRNPIKPKPDESFWKWCNIKFENDATSSLKMMLHQVWKWCYIKFENDATSSQVWDQIVLDASTFLGTRGRETS